MGGEVKIQGGKNSAMKHVITPFLTDDDCVIKNVPDISSIKNLLEIVRIHGGDVQWYGKNEVKINTSRAREAVEIPEGMFFHTSGGILTIPLLVNRVGKCVIENKSGRRDTGGDQIGRPFNLDLYPNVGIKVDVNKDRMEFAATGVTPFVYDADGRFAPTVIAVFSALGKRGTSEVINPVAVEEFEDTLKMVEGMGAEIDRKENKLLVTGGIKLHGIVWNNLADKNDLVTWMAAAIANESAIEITGVPFDEFKLEGLLKFMKSTGVIYEINRGSQKMRIEENGLKHLRPVKITADLRLGFTSEWQVLMSPVLALIRGISTVADGISRDRMWHWEELAKMGAKFKYIRDGRFEEFNGKPRAVRIEGVDKLNGAEVEARDLRSAAALLIAGMAAGGVTKVVDDKDHLKRGYEDFAQRAMALGADIQMI